MPGDLKLTSQSFRLSDLVQMVRTGRLRPASFSRPPVWDSSQVINLLDSILRGYPIGNLVFIEESAPEADVVLGNMVIHAPPTQHALIVIDGLQRIIAVVNALDSTDERYQIYYDVEKQNFAANPAVHHSMLPIHVAADTSLLVKWFRAHPFLSEPEENSCWRLSEALSSYNVPATIIGGPNARSTAIDVFTRINSGGVSLTKSDLTRARSKDLGVSDLGLERMLTEVERTGFGTISISLAAQCALSVTKDVAAGNRKALARRNPLQSFQQLPLALQEEVTDEAIRALIPVIDFIRQDAGIPHIRLLPRTATLPVITQYANEFGLPIGRERELLRRYLWRSGTVNDPNLAPDSSGTLDISTSSLESATSLLDSISSYPGPHWQPDMSAVRLNQADGRFNALGLLSLQPPFLAPTEELIEPPNVPISATAIFTPWLNEAKSPFTPLLPRSFTKNRPVSLANYLLHPPVKQKTLFAAVVAAGPDGADALTRHSIDDSALELLRNGDFEGFITYRERRMFFVILRRVQAMARWGFRDHGSLPNINDESDTIG